MYVVEVAPLRRGSALGTLSYFSSTRYERGSIVSIPLRSQETRGIVLAVSEVSATKAALRRATFSLRRLPEQEAPGALPEAFLGTVAELAEYYAAQPGAVLFSLLPAECKNGSIPLPVQSDTDTSGFEHLVFSARREERLSSYKRIVRESFARGLSVVLVTPTLEEGHELHGELARGIEDRAILLAGGVGLRALRSRYALLSRSTEPLLIVATPNHAFLHPRVGTFIVERSRARSYRAQQRPYLDLRRALLTYARRAGCRYISADTLVRAEDEYLLREGLAQPYEEHPVRIPLPGTLKVITMKEKPDGTVPFHLFSPQLLTALEKHHTKHSFLLATRRGLAPVVACLDCGNILRCPQSGSPLALHRKIEDGVETRWLVSSVSGFSRRADDLCDACGSWRLRERGIGIQHIYNELLEHVPRERLFLLDHETAPTHKKAAAVRDAFYATRGGILLGTALALPYLHQPVALSAVVSLEGLRAIPSWRQEEEALGTLLALREQTDGPVLIQTRGKDDELLAHAKRGTVGTFLDEELAVRREFAYPPYRTFVHLAWRKGAGDAGDTIGNAVTDALTPFDPTLYDAPDAEALVGYALLRLTPEQWPDDAIVDALRSLPPTVRIAIDPDRVV